MEDNAQYVIRALRWERFRLLFSFILAARAFLPVIKQLFAGSCR